MSNIDENKTTPTQQEQLLKELLAEREKEKEKEKKKGERTLLADRALALHKKDLGIHTLIYLVMSIGGVLLAFLPMMSIAGKGFSLCEIMWDIVNGLIMGKQDTIIHLLLKNNIIAEIVLVIMFFIVIIPLFDLLRHFVQWLMGGGLIGISKKRIRDAIENPHLYVTGSVKGSSMVMAVLSALLSFAMLIGGPLAISINLKVLAPISVVTVVIGELIFAAAVIGRLIWVWKFTNNTSEEAQALLSAFASKKA